ncbi:Bromodomain [Dillenia turbinata]|uniref:Bromodomain n=1 Tax=Dillenia turbinata TaxID=194707 RepID=A0AAN8UPB5_9MAGN
MGLHDLKHRWIFNSPVDVVGMGLHDYFQKIKHPMDLGIMESKLRKGLYSSTSDFSADVQFTFDNTLLCNPKGHDAYKMVELLCNKLSFEQTQCPFWRGDPARKWVARARWVLKFAQNCYVTIGPSSLDLQVLFKPSKAIGVAFLRPPKHLLTPGGSP